jgi:hypothetical protein
LCAEEWATLIAIEETGANAGPGSDTEAAYGRAFRDDEAIPEELLLPVVVDHADSAETPALSAADLPPNLLGPLDLPPNLLGPLQLPANLLGPLIENIRVADPEVATTTL